MDMKRKFFTLIIMAAMMLTFLPAAVFAEGEEPVKPVKAEWNGLFDLKGVIGTDELTNLETADVASFKVTFSDGSEKNYVYKEFTRDEGNPGEYTEKGFYAKGEDPESEASSFYPYVYEEDAEVNFKEGWNDVKMEMLIPYVVSGKGTDDEDVDYVSLQCGVKVLCAVEKPVKVEFVPAEGFTPRCYVGLNYLSEEDLYGEGNKFLVTKQVMDYDKGEYTEYSEPYYYAKGTDLEGEEEEGFFLSGKVSSSRFEFDGGVFNFSKGINEVELTYSEYITELDDEVSVQYTISLDVQKYDAYADYPIYDYTGKVIKPVFKVYDSDDKRISSKEYEYATPKNKKMGWYDVEISFKDEFKDKYLNPSFTASYGIGPKMPVFRKITGGKKSLTVTWKKLTSSQLKKVDGYYIEIAQDKNFMKGAKTIKVTGKTLKSGKKVIKKLAKGKKYYVLMYAYKKIKQGGVSFSMPSEYTKVKTGKTK